jgi:shikimate kinase
MKISIALMLAALTFSPALFACGAADQQCSSQLGRAYDQLNREYWILKQCAAESCQTTHQEKADRIKSEIARLEAKR